MLRIVLEGLEDLALKMSNTRPNNNFLNVCPILFLAWVPFYFKFSSRLRDIESMVYQQIPGGAPSLEGFQCIIESEHISQSASAGQN